MVPFSHRKHKKTIGFCNNLFSNCLKFVVLPKSMVLSPFYDEATVSWWHEHVGRSCKERHCWLVLRLCWWWWVCRGWKDCFLSKTLRKRRRLLFRMVGKQFCLEALRPRIPESTTGRTWRSCRKCVPRINGGSKCWARTFPFSSSAFGRSLLFLFKDQCAIYLFSEGTSIKPTVVELTDNSPPCN